jgi:hypothetical protein
MKEYLSLLMHSHGMKMKCCRDGIFHADEKKHFIISKIIIHLQLNPFLI